MLESPAMPAWCLRRAAIGGHPQRVLAQIGIVRGEKNTGFRHQTGKDQSVHVELIEQKLERRSEKCRVARLEDGIIVGMRRQRVGNRARSAASREAAVDHLTKIRVPMAEMIVRIDARHLGTPRSFLQTSRLARRAHRPRRKLGCARKIERIHEIDEQQGCAAA